jgi:prepilin-type N-terminal cleavage/methylation domain-containing protein
MRYGFTIIELLLVCAIAGALALVGVPRVRDTADRMAVHRAGTELVRFHREARAMAIFRAAPVRVLLDGDSLIGMLADSVVLARPGPAAFGVRLSATRPEFAFGPAGLAWGPANTRLTLERGRVVDEYVASRQGRLRRTQ